MIGLRPNAPRVRHLLSLLEASRTALAEATTADGAAFARAEIAAIQHTLWLAGYRPENEEA